jgi:molecular chaperone HtpG
LSLVLLAALSAYMLPKELPPFSLEKAELRGGKKLALYAGILYEQARLIEGLPVEDPIAYAKAVCSLLV